MRPASTDSCIRYLKSALTLIKANSDSLIGVNAWASSVSAVVFIRSASTDISFFGQSAGAFNQGYELSLTPANGVDTVSPYTTHYTDLVADRSRFPLTAYLGPGDPTCPARLRWQGQAPHQGSPRSALGCRLLRALIFSFLADELDALAMVSFLLSLQLLRACRRHRAFAPTFS